MRTYGWVGLGILVLGQLCLLVGVPVVTTWYTPIMWTGYILLVDAAVRALRSASLLSARRDELPLLLVASVGWWVMFEVYNVYLENWHYIGQPASYWVRIPGYLWAYATIFPAVFETADLLMALGLARRFHTRPIAIPTEWLAASGIVGAVCVTVPLLIPPPLSWYLFGLVWIGFVLLLEPILYRCGGRSLLRAVSRGQWGVLWAYLLAGAVCGLLWEFWNYWAGAKWVYTVPFWPRANYFEIPLLGFLGFLPFAWECYALFGFTLLAWNWRGLRPQHARLVLGTLLSLLLFLGLRMLPQPFGFSPSWPDPEPKAVAPLVLFGPHLTTADLRQGLALARNDRDPGLVAIGMYPPHDPGWRRMVPLLRDEDPVVRRRAHLVFRNMSRFNRLASLREPSPVVLDIPHRAGTLNP